MKRIVILCCVIINMLWLTGCGPMYQTTYTYIPPKKAEGRICIMQCQNQKNLCERLAQSDYDNCLARARDDARFQYESYRYERTSRGQSVDKDMNSFYSPYRCSRNAGCDADYRGCYETCGGQIIPHTVCVAFCNMK